MTDPARPLAPGRPTVGSRWAAGRQPDVTAALLRYRVMAYLVGTLLVVLVCVGVPLEFIGGHKGVDVVLGTLHGYLYVILLLAFADLARRRRFPFAWIVVVALCGTIPFLSFVAERAVTHRIRDGRL